MKIDAADMKRYVSPVEFYNPTLPTPDYDDVTLPLPPPQSPPKTPDKARKRRQLHIKLPSLNNVPRVERVARRKYYKKDDIIEKADIYVDTRKNISPERKWKVMKEWKCYLTWIDFKIHLPSPDQRKTTPNPQLSPPPVIVHEKPMGELISINQLLDTNVPDAFSTQKSGSCSSFIVITKTKLKLLNMMRTKKIIPASSRPLHI